METFVVERMYGHLQKPYKIKIEEVPEGLTEMRTNGPGHRVGIVEELDLEARKARMNEEEKRAMA